MMVPGQAVQLGEGPAEQAARRGDLGEPNFLLIWSLSRCWQEALTSCNDRLLHGAGGGECVLTGCFRY